MKLEIPEDYTDFLYWVKERTEDFWSKNPETTEEDLVCEKWIHGAKWVGLSELQIDSIEKKYRIKFSAEHRLFLKILHSIDRKETVECTDTFDEDEEIKFRHNPFFYNWLIDEQEIRDRLNWPRKTILEDVLGPNQVWLKSWGETRPKSNEQKEKLFSEWFEKTPKLIPVRGHRFTVTGMEYTPVLSIYGSDIIVYGWNMRHYLLNELKEHLNIHNLVYDKDYDEWYAAPSQEFKEINKVEYEKAKNKSIPLWEEIILYWSSGWSSYGKEYPYSEDELIHPIVKTFNAKDEEDKKI